jgi:hypothetical protein
MSTALCMKFLACLANLPEFDTDEQAATGGVLDPTGVYRWYKTSRQHVSGMNGIPKRVLAA